MSKYKVKRNDRITLKCENKDTIVSVLKSVQFILSKYNQNRELHCHGVVPELTGTFEQFDDCTRRCYGGPRNCDSTELDN